MKKHEASYAGYVYKKPVSYWSETEEVKKHLTKVSFNKKSKIEKGGIPIISDGKTAYIDSDDGHTAIIASSGMMKSLSCFTPLIYTLGRSNTPENMVITDPKGELYNLTAGMLREDGYKVFCIDFRSMDKDCFNILKYAAQIYRNGNKDQGLSLLSNIVNTLSEDQRKITKDVFWSDTSRMYMNATGALMFESYPKIEQINVLNWSDFNTLECAKYIESSFLSAMPDNMIKSSLMQILSSPENTLRCILVSAAGCFGVFNQNPKLSRMLSHNTFELDDLLNPKTALFIVTDDTTSTADPIVGIIISQIQSFLIDKAYHSKDGHLETRINFVLDEFASIPIPNMDKALATHRSRNIRYYLCVQSLALLNERYNNPEKLLSNCTSTLYLGSTELELLNNLEAKLGNTNITPDGIEKPLCSITDLMMLKKEWNYKEAIYINISKGIKYSTILPSIYIYDNKKYEVPSYDINPPDVEIYSPCTFIDSILDRDIPLPFYYDFNEEEEKTDIKIAEESKITYIDHFFNEVLDSSDDEEE